MTTSFRFVCELPTGLHARPASLLAETARRFRAVARVINEQTRAEAEARSVLSVIGLDIQHGHAVLVEAVGDDAADLLEAVRVLVAGRFGEGVQSAEFRVQSGEGAKFVARVPAPLRRAGVEVLTGRPVSEGVGEGIAVIVGGLAIPERLAKARAGAGGTEHERRVVCEAIEEVRGEIERHLKTARHGLEAELLRAHLGIVDDPALRVRIDEALAGGASAACAVVKAGEHFSARLRASSSAYIRDRVADVEDIARRILEKIDPEAMKACPVELRGESVLVADTLGVSQLMALDRSRLKGMVLGSVGETAHTVILARSLGIPTLVGVESAPSAIGAGKRVIVDAVGGFVVRDVADGVVDYYRREGRIRGRRRERLRPLLRKRGATRDGKSLEVAANAAGPEEIGAAMEAGADSVGLLRTELLFLDREEAPSEEEQYELYRAAVEAASRSNDERTDRSKQRSVAREPREVIIRTLDIGGDKPAPYLRPPAEDNPFLGCRGLRLYSKYPELIRAQLRAVCRASAHGSIKVMAPMVGTVAEAKWFCDQVSAVQAELAREGVAHDANMAVGIMMEVPSAALIMDQLAHVVDFISIGTNDLCQYWMAADRTNPSVAGMNNPRQPSFLRLLDRIVSDARAHGCWVGVCGEMAGDVVNLPLLVGMGVEEISMAAGGVGRIKGKLARLDTGECREVLERAMGCETAEQVEELLKKAGSGKWEGGSAEKAGPLDEDLVLIDCDAATKEQVIQEMVGALHVAGRTEDPRGVEEAIWKREGEYATALGFGFAIPHCRSDAVSAPSIVVARFGAPVEWEAKDGQPVGMAIMLVVRASDADATHLKLLAKLARRLMHEGFREALMSARDAGGVLGVLERELELR